MSSTARPNWGLDGPVPRPAFGLVRLADGRPDARPCGQPHVLARHGQTGVPFLAWSSQAGEPGARLDTGEGSGPA